MGKLLPVTAQTINAEQRRREAEIKQRIAERRARLLADNEDQRLMSKENYE
jgi:hypothetical protein